MQLRRKLFLVLGAMSTLPLLILLFEVAERVESDLETRAESEMGATLNMMGRELSTLMDTQKSIAKGLAQVPAVESFLSVLNRGDLALYDARSTRVAEFFKSYQATVPSIQALRLADPNGKVLVKVKEGKLIEPSYTDDRGRPIVEDIAYKAFFRMAVGTEDESVSVSNFERGKVAGDVDFCPAMIRYTVPIRDINGDLNALLVVNMWGRRVDHTVEASLGGYPGQAYIVEVNDQREDRDGIYLYHREAERRFANQLGTDYRFSDSLRNAEWERLRYVEGRGTLETSDGRLLFYQPFDPYADRPLKWLLLVETTRASIVSPVSHLRDSIWYLLAAVLLVSLVLARWAASRLARPVHDLAAIITRYGDGDHSARYHDNRRDEVGAAGRAFNYLAESLEEAERERDKAEHAARQSERLAAIGEMAAGIGHEINNPLMNIMSLASLIEESAAEQDEQLKKDLQLLQSEGRRCARIVQGVLNFARENKPSYRQFDMAQLIDDTCELLKHRAEAATVELLQDIEGPLPMEGDPNQLQQVLVNVLLNALHASRPGTTIRIHARQHDGNTMVEVLDSGEGISEDDLEKVFNPFFTTKPEGSGTGLGLSMSYGIVNQHGGTIELENRGEGGVRVVLALPVSSAEAEQGDGDEDVSEVRYVG